MRFIGIIALNLMLLGLAGCAPSGLEGSRGEKAGETIVAKPSVEKPVSEEPGVAGPPIVVPAVDTPVVKTAGPEKAALGSGLPILYYHSIEQEAGNPLRIPPEQFEAQMKYLSDEGYETIKLSDLPSYFSGAKAMPPKPVIITFDDGYADNYTNAYPIMQKYGFTGTVFMVAEYLDGDGYLTTSQLQEMLAAGWEVGGHTVTHPHLGELERPELEYELSYGKLLLEQKLGYEVKSFAYPYGEYTAEVVRMVEEAGYDSGVTINRGWARPEHSPLLWSRVYCYADMGMEEFIKRVTRPDY